MIIHRAARFAAKLVTLPCMAVFSVAASARAPIPMAAPVYFFQGVGVPAGANGFSSAESVTADGGFVLGVHGSLTQRTPFVVDAFPRGRRDLGPVVAGGIFADRPAASNGLGLIICSNLGPVSDGGIRTNTSPWIQTTNLFAPTVTGLLPVAINADGTLIATHGVYSTGAQARIVFDNGAPVDMAAQISASLGLTGAVTIHDVAAYRRISVGTVIDVMTGAHRVFWYDHVTQQARQIAIPPFQYYPLYETTVRVSGDGLTTVVTYYDYNTSLFYIWQDFDNGVQSANGLLGAGTFQTQVVLGLNETGQTAVGMSNLGGNGARAAIWENGTGVYLTQALASRGLSASNFSWLSKVSDISARGGVLAGVGLDPIMRAEGFVARIPVAKVRSDFNRSGLVDPSDLSDFLTAFAAGNLSADWDYNGLLQPIDITLFSNDHATGQ